MFAKFRDVISQILKWKENHDVGTEEKNTKACADNGSTMKDHLSFHCLKKFVLFHSMEGKLHNGIAC